ncbi:MAG: glycerate kinase [Longispora sp.]|nr:glycerate kinase [Longispora sp. (in: high G+C Gram-positive bacteria)]
MRIVVCPDKFAGTLTAPDVTAAIIEGWVSVSADTLISLPLSDGGPGFVEVVRRLPGASVSEVLTVDPLGRPVKAHIVRLGDVVYVESAQVCGLDLLRPEERKPMVTTSYGLGLLLTAAGGTGAREIAIGLGGSATNDAGAGMLAALGAPAVDASGVPLPPGGGVLGSCHALGGVPDWGASTLVAASDVDYPLVGVYGASNVFGPQKGASREEVAVLDAAVERFAEVLERDLDTCPTGLGTLPGGGAAGGVGAAILALGGRRKSGIGLVAELIGLDEMIVGADLVITGEGSLDAQSLRGKVVSGVAEVAAEHGVPCVVVAGRSIVGRREAGAAGISEVYSLVEYFGDVDRAMSQPVPGLFGIGERLARQWGRMSG